MMIIEQYQPNQGDRGEARSKPLLKLGAAKPQKTPSPLPQPLALNRAPAQDGEERPAKLKQAGVERRMQIWQHHSLL
jgi:hypothetical protein